MIVTFVAEPSGECHEPREEDWLPIVGPTAWLLGHLIWSEVSQGRVSEWDVAQLGLRLGVSPSEAESGQVLRSIDRLRRFGLIASTDRFGHYVIRRDWGTAPRKRGYRAHANSGRAAS